MIYLFTLRRLHRCFLERDLVHHKMLIRKFFRFPLLIDDFPLLIKKITTIFLFLGLLVIGLVVLIQMKEGQSNALFHHKSNEAHTNTNAKCTVGLSNDFTTNMGCASDID